MDVPRDPDRLSFLQASPGALLSGRELVAPAGIRVIRLPEQQLNRCAR